MDKKAYTLIEMMIVLVISVILSGLIFLFYSKGRTAFEALDVQAQLTDNAKMAIEEITRDLTESSSGTITVDAAGVVPFFTDPIDNHNRQILIFASARGDPGVTPGEDGVHANNDYAHIDSDYKPTWRCAIIYCPYVTNDGITQIRKYVDYGSFIGYYDSSANIFPFSLASITVNSINLIRGDGTTLVLPRNSGFVRVNYLSAEDSNNNGALDANEDDGNDNMPPDNADGVLDGGADFTLSGNVLKIKLFLSKSETTFSQNIRYLSITLDGSAKPRNK